MIRNDFNDYLEKYIEGHLLNDLQTISTRDPEINDRSGNLAYPLAIAVCSAMEFMGLLLQNRSPVRDDGSVDASTGLAHYIKHYLSQTDAKYKALVEIAPRLIRNGIAHAYATKGAVAITRIGTRDRSHLIRYTADDILVINSNYLYEDFVKSYQEVVKPLISPEGDKYKHVSENYELIRNAYKNEVSRVSNETKKSLDKASIPWKYADYPAGVGDSLILDIENNGDMPIYVS